MIRVGLSVREKQIAVTRYAKKYRIRKIFVLYWRAFKTIYDAGCEIEYVEWADTIEYPYFYRLLEEIDDKCLIVVDECMRTQNRSELTYNCIHHYLNQTPHKIIYEYFPFIENEDDFLILLDFQNKGKYRGKGFSWGFLKDEDVEVKENPITFDIQPVPVTDKQAALYEKRKADLFANLGKKDPDTIPRSLHVFAGNWKKPHIKWDGQYVARNSRLNLDNVTTYRKFAEAPTALGLNAEWTIVDFPHRRIELNDFLKLTRAASIRFLSTGLPVDNYYQSEFRAWLERVKQFNAKAGVC